MVWSDADDNEKFCQDLKLFATKFASWYLRDGGYNYFLLNKDDNVTSQDKCQQQNK